MKKCPQCGSARGDVPHCKPGSVMQCRHNGLTWEKVEPLNESEIQLIEKEVAISYLPEQPRIAIIRLLKTIRALKGRAS